MTPNRFIVRDAAGQELAYVYYESEPGRRSAAKLLSKDEARRRCEGADDALASSAPPHAARAVSR